MTGPVICDACGQQWPRHPALEVECPDCGAAIGVHCKKPSGHNFWEHELPHVNRERRALEAGAFSKCQAALGRRRRESVQPPLLELLG